MDKGLEFVAHAGLIGICATAFLDISNLILARVFGMRLPDYNMVGRWIGYFPQGRLTHAAIGKAERVPGETIIGWVAHYLIGFVFAGILLLIFGPEWAQRPSFAPALIVGVATVAAPYLIMQPAMGAGFFASRTPHPNAARARSLLSHALFGVGLYVASAIIAVMR